MHMILLPVVWSADRGGFGQEVPASDGASSCAPNLGSHVKGGWQESHQAPHGHSVYTPQLCAIARLGHLGRMVDISANIRLRPIRIGFLVRPNDLASVREIMRYGAAVWGGIYNPIIPVFNTPPKAWASEPFDRVRGIGVAKGYIHFFEPDVYVEAEKGLLELVGLGAVRDRLTVYPDVLTLAELLRPEQVGANRFRRASAAIQPGSPKARATARR
jgi:hypothetical protein